MDPDFETDRFFVFGRERDSDKNSPSFRRRDLLPLLFRERRAPLRDFRADELLRVRAPDFGRLTRRPFAFFDFLFSFFFGADEELLSESEELDEAELGNVTPVCNKQKQKRIAVSKQWKIFLWRRRP